MAGKQLGEMNGPGKPNYAAKVGAKSRLPATQGRILHHMYEYTPDHLPADLGFLAFGLALLLGGGLLVRAGRQL